MTLHSQRPHGLLDSLPSESFVFGMTPSAKYQSGLGTSSPLLAGVDRGFSGNLLDRTDATDDAP